MPFLVFLELARIPAAGFLVFLNFLQGVSPVVATPSAMPSLPSSGHALPVPSPRDRTSITVFPMDMRAGRTVSAELPEPLPMNAWWSSGVLDPWPAPLFPWPLKVTIASNGIEATWPETTVIPTAVMHSPIDILALRPQSETLVRARVLRWGDWDVTYRIERSGGSTAYDVSLAQGSPFVFVRSSDVRFVVAVPPGSSVRTVPCSTPCGDAVLITAPRRRYLLTLPPGSDLTIDGLSVLVKPTGLFSIAALAPGTEPETYLASALQPIEGTRADYRVLPENVDTTFMFPRRTLIGMLPHQSAYLRSAPGRLLGTYDTVRGTIELYEGSSFVTSLPRPPLLPGLPSLGDTVTLEELQADFATVPPVTQGDVYSAAKQVLRSAQLAELAQTAGDLNLARDTLARAESLVADWCTAETSDVRERVLTYDNQLGGIIPLPPAFGSEHYNDHHFHAGYFLHAGATLARLDPSFARNYSDCMLLLIRDIASPDREDPSFPYLRHFDVYAGHSWANGGTLFADGQNQESTSEALQAWHAIALWGRVTGDRAIEDLGIWLLAQETAGTQAYWFNALPGRSTLAASFTKPMVSILWGGKADYATFFDASPAAIHGIQFFPVTTALLPVLNSSILDRLVLPLRAGSPTIWTSNMTLVGALAGERRALASSDPIDPVLSPSYVRHWASAAEVLGAYRSDIRSVGSCGAVFERGGVLTAAVYRFPGSSSSCAFIDTRSGTWSTIESLGIGWNIRALSF